MEYPDKEFIILEGCDKVGKTTIGKQLANYYGLAYVHVGVPPATAQTSEDILKWHKEILWPLIHDKELKGAVIDRFHLSNIVYGTVMQHHKILSSAGAVSLERTFLKHKSVIVYCYRNLADIKQAFIDDEEELITPDLIEPIMRKYAELFHPKEPTAYGTKLPVVTKIFPEGVSDVAAILNNKYKFTKPTMQELKFAKENEYVPN